MDKERYLDIIMGIEGQITRSEARALVDLTKEIPSDSLIVEIGTYRGRSTIALAFGSLIHDKNRVYAIDPHLPFKGLLGGIFGPGDLSALYKNIVFADLGEKISVVCLPSVKVARSWSNKNIGLLWIDGDHRYNSVRADFEAWENFIIDNGIIVFHDSHIEDIRKLIEELIASDKINHLGTIDSLSWFSKLLIS
jgi:hypothetical protein